MVKHRNETNKKRVRKTSRSELEMSFKQDTKADVNLREVKNQVIAVKLQPKSVDNIENETTYYSLKGLTEYFKNKFNVDFNAVELLSFWDTKSLLPYVKEMQATGKDDIIFDKTKAKIYLQYLAKTQDKSDDIFMDEVPFIEASKKQLSKI